MASLSILGRSSNNVIGLEVCATTSEISEIRSAEWKNARPRSLVSEKIPAVLLVEVDNGLNLYNPSIGDQCSRSHGRPSRVRCLHEFVFHGAEGGKLCSPVSFKVWALPDMESVEHDYIVEVCAGGVQGGLDALKCTTYLSFKRSDILPLTVSPPHYDP